MDGTPATVDLGTFELRSGASVHVYARILIDFTLYPEPPPEERGPFIDDIMPRAMEHLREELSHLRYRVGEWQSIDPTEA